MKIWLPNPEGSEIFFYPTFYALEFLFTQPFSLRPQPRQSIMTGPLGSHNHYSKETRGTTYLSQRMKPTKPSL